MYQLDKISVLNTTPDIFNRSKMSGRKCVDNQRQKKKNARIITIPIHYLRLERLRLESKMYPLII